MMSAKNNAERLIASFKRRLQRLKGQKALEVRTVGPRILTEIEEMKVAIKKLQTTLAASAMDIGLNKGDLRDLNPKQRVQMYLYGDIPPLSVERQSALMDALAELIGIPSQAKADRRTSTIQFPFGLNGWDITLLSLLIVSLVMGFFAVYCRGVICLPPPTATPSPTMITPGESITSTVTVTSPLTLTPTNTPTLPRPLTDTPIIITGFVNYDGLYLRDGPDTSYNIIRSLPYRTEVTILGRTKDRDWFHVKALETEGWVWAVSVTLDDPDKFAKIPVETD